MTKKDMMELRRRFTKDSCTFTKMAGCYVNNDKEKVLTFNETFLNLNNDEVNKYLDIVKKVTLGKIGDNLLELGFEEQEDISENRQNFLLGLKESGLKNEDLLDCLYDLIIKSYNYVGYYLIVLYHDVYDVMNKTSDNRAIDESEEMYEYMVCAICPVKLSKPGLGYLKDQNRIGTRIRDWIVEAPENGFLYPAFTDRSSDVNSLMYYTKNAKEPKADFMSGGLGCNSKQTNTEQKIVFNNILEDSLGEESDFIIRSIHQNINEMINEDEERLDPICMNNDILKNVLNKSGVPEDLVPMIEETYEAEFSDKLPMAESIIDKKIIKKIEEKQMKTNIEDKKNYTIIIQAKPEKENQIIKQVIDGKNCIVIPLGDEENAKVNGNEILK
jgi:hypothetical protein